jgi:DNA polymerase (family X)
MENREVARILRETAQLLEIDGAMIGRFRSYERAAQLLDSLPESVEELAVDRKKLMELPGIGDGMADHIQEILKTSEYSLRNKLLKKYPESILRLLDLQSLGPKKVAFLWKTFKAGSVDEVEKLARDGKLRDLAGFGEKSEENILKAIEVFKKSAGRFHIDFAEEQAEKLASYIQSFGKPIEAVTPAGSLRRGKETVGDLDLLVTMVPGKPTRASVEAIAEHILVFPGIEQKLARGENKVSFLLKDGLQVDVRILEKEVFGAALLYFTGSKEHNVALRGRANKMGYTLNEYALATLKCERPVARATETEIYEKLGLDYIPPELRENTGEIDAAEEHRLPHLIELADMRGDLQMHTTASDGKNSIEEMALAAKELGYEYIIFRSLTTARL